MDYNLSFWPLGFYVYLSFKITVSPWLSKLAQILDADLLLHLLFVRSRPVNVMNLWEGKKGNEGNKDFFLFYFSRRNMMQRIAAETSLYFYESIFPVGNKEDEGLLKPVWAIKDN